MQPLLIRKCKTTVFICLITCFAGVLYQLINEKRLDHNSVLFGFPLGLFFCVLELFLYPTAEKRIRRWPFTKTLRVKSLFYTMVIYIVTLSLVIIIGLFEGRKMRELSTVLISPSQFILVLYTLVVYGTLIFFLQINHLLGAGILWKFMRGRYHKPHEEERIFMFLDMKSSTTIAEKIGDVRFYSLLNELFHEISQPVLQTQAEIYQYVGDEVVLTWEVEDGLRNSNCLQTFFLFQDRLLQNSEKYLESFGVRPEFKAGLHYGKVVSAQIGDLKREIVYNGDVLNTTARIRDACNTYHRDCLISGMLMNRLKERNGFQWERINKVTLRGKETAVELFSVHNPHALAPALAV